MNNGVIFNKMSLFPPNPQKNLLPYDGMVNDFGIVIDNPTKLYQTLLTKLPWQPDKVTIFNKTHITKRQIVWMGDNVSYRYSGHSRISIPWVNDVFHVKQLIEKLLKTQSIQTSFNACLLNYYPTGNEGMGYHADDEPELGFEPVIATLSLGETRKFVFKHNHSKQKVAINLINGQLLVMRGQTQNHWQHSITKTKMVKNGRISLTFRYIVPVL